MKRYYATSYKSRVNRLAVLKKKYAQVDSSLIDKAFDEAVKKAILEELQLKISALEYLLS